MKKTISCCDKCGATLTGNWTGVIECVRNYEVECESSTEWRDLCPDCKKMYDTFWNTVPRRKRTAGTDEITAIMAMHHAGMAADRIAGVLKRKRNDIMAIIQEQKKKAVS